MALTNAEIFSGTVGSDSIFQGIAHHQRNVQSNRFIPIIVDLSVEITLGRALLDAIANNSNLEDIFKTDDEIRILQSIEYCAFVAPNVDIQIRAYAGSTTHKRIAPATEVTYLPVAAVIRNYCFGDALATAIQIDVGAEV